MEKITVIERVKTGLCSFVLVWFGLVSLVYGISKFMGYLIPKPFL